MRSLATQPVRQTRPAEIKRFLATRPEVQHGHRDQALFNNTIGNDNTANGFGALFSNTTGSLNTANGVWCTRKQHNGQQQHGQWLDCARFQHNRQREYG